MAQKRIYLASRSPRRRELLKQVGVGFELLLLREGPDRDADVNEAQVPGELPGDYALRIARTKAEIASIRVSQRALLQQYPVLAADTTVVLDERVIGKPVDAEHAVQILRMLSGREHRVITAVALAKKERIESRVSTSSVWFRDLDDAEIRRYVDSGEPLDKAGAYAIQGRAAAFAARIDGSYSGIMGLPLAETTELLRKFGIEIF